MDHRGWRPPAAARSSDGCPATTPKEGTHTAVISAPPPMKGTRHPLRCPKPHNHKSRVHYPGSRPRIARSVNEAIAELSGTERVVGAILIGLEHMRAEPLGQLIMGDIRPGHDGGAVSASPLVAKIAEEMIGHNNPLAAQWLFRITFSLWYWPLKDKQTEQELVQRFAAPSVTQGLR